MNDLDICKRIAEIEGLEITQITSSCVFVFNNDNSCQYFKEKVYNPLTNDALCFRLMRKHGVDIKHYSDTGLFEALIYDDPEDNPVGMDLNSSLNKAICLAIIEAHNE